MTNGGDVVIDGNGAQDLLFQDNSLINTGGGDFTLISNAPQGITFRDRAAIVTGGGDINITGNGTQGILIKKDAALSSQGGNITLIEQRSTGIQLEGDARVTAGTGDITFRANEMAFGVNAVIAGTGNAILQTISPTTGMTLGGIVENGALNLSTNDLASLQNGFSNIIFNSVTASNTVTLYAPLTFNDPVSLAGGSNLVGTNQTQTWNITGFNQGSLDPILFPNGFTFGNIETIFAGSGNDTFKFQTGGTITGSLNPGFGFDLLDLSSSLDPYTLNVNTNTITGLNTFSLSNFESFTVGGSAFDRILGLANQNNIFTLIGNNAGTLIAGSNPALTFSGFENLTGGNAIDQFIFNNGSKIDGIVDGSGGTNDLIDLSLISTPIIANLDPSNLLTVGSGPFATATNVEQLIGGMGSSDQIIGSSNIGNNFTVNGLNQVTLQRFGQNILNFSSFENLTGGTANDTFTLNGGTLSGAIDGQGGIDTFIADNVNNNFVITSIDQGSATGIANGFSNIQNLVGG
ncbi:MAG: hypothetical protein HC796_01240, partial [Synechococcaceae cyanobacterium RL_1_2]|nr:hypothetical protein [Synechococcaceae cyanobacterium RL_1_2]